MAKIVDKYIEFIVAFVVFYFNFDTSFAADANPLYERFMFIVQGVVLLLLFQKPTIYKLGNAIFAPLLLILLVALVGLSHDYNSLTYFYKIFLIILCYQLATKIDFEKFQIAFYKIVFVFAIISLVFFAMLSITGSIGFGYEFHSDMAEYKTNFLFSYLQHLSFRNGSIFREPGVFQIYLNVALLFYYNINRDRFIDKYTIIFFVALFSTLSTGGIIIAGAIAIVAYSQKQKKSSATIVSLILVTIVSYYAISEMSEMIFGKISYGAKEMGSANARLYSVIVPLRIMLDYPVFGCGTSEFNSIISHYPIEGNTMSVYQVTNTFTTNFATTGFFVGLTYLFLFCKGIRRFNFGYKSKLIIILLAVAIFSNENTLYSLLFNFLVFSGVVNGKKVGYKIKGVS